MSPVLARNFSVSPLAFSSSQYSLVRRHCQTMAWQIGGYLMAGINAGENAAGLGHTKQAIGLDVGDDQTDLVNVSGQHHLKGASGFSTQTTLPV